MPGKQHIPKSKTIYSDLSPSLPPFWVIHLYFLGFLGLKLCPTFAVVLRKPANLTNPVPPVTFQLIRVKTQKSAKPASCMSPIARGVTYQTIPGFSTTGWGNNGELSIEAAVLCMQRPNRTQASLLKRIGRLFGFISQQQMFANSHLPSSV